MYFCTSKKIISLFVKYIEVTDINDRKRVAPVRRRRLLDAWRCCFVLMVATVVIFLFVYGNLHFGCLGRVLVWLVFLQWLIMLLQVIYCIYYFPKVTPLMIHRCLQQRKKGNKNIHFERTYVPIEAISPNLILAVDKAEGMDLFFYCRGFLFKGLRAAYKHNQIYSTLRGGSSISQQTAKNCFLPLSRTLLRKLLEAYYVVLMELLWGKKRIMECYLNIIEFGQGIFGCEAASRHYFHHSADTLSVEESVLLAATLPWPLKANPDNRTEAFDKRVNIILNRMQVVEPVNWNARYEDLDPQKLEEGNRGLLFFIKWWILQKFSIK